MKPHTTLALLITAAVTLAFAPLAQACNSCGCSTKQAQQADAPNMTVALAAADDKPSTQPATKPATKPAHTHSHGDHEHSHDHADHGHGHHPQHGDHAAHAKDGKDVKEHAMWWESVDHLVAVMVPTQGNTARGTVHFKEVEGGVKITGTFAGLSPNAKHAIHIHEFGDMTANNGTSAGGHYNPEGHKHGLPNGDEIHAGDLGNLETNSAGTATLSMTVDNITLVDLKNPIIGRGMIIHAKHDDGGQPTGNAGARIAYGVIGIAQSK